MKRFHVHVSVENLDESIRFYSTMFAAEPTIARADYAKWQLEDPRVNFAISKHGAPAGLNHLGIQAASAEELAEMDARLQRLQGVEEEIGAACCYAKSDKYWATDPQGIAWETFHTLESIPVFGGEAKTQEGACCIPLAPSTQDAAPCCVPKTKAGACC
jgi:hypothetical protein